VRKRRGFNDAIELLEDHGELSAASLLKRELEPEDDESIAQFIEQGDSEMARRWRLQRSDAGLYLNRTAKTEGRMAPLAALLSEVRAKLEEEGRWEQAEEWRIATDGTMRLERDSDGQYKAWTDHHGVFTGCFQTFPEAYEAAHVFRAVQIDLYYAIGWSSWERPGADPERRYRYLARLAQEARADEEIPRTKVAELLEDGQEWTKTGVSVWTDEWTDWDGDCKPNVSFAVTNRTLRMESESPTLERALEFMGLFRRLQSDLAAVLEWRWL
jgi:hypothetical protein